MIDAGQFPRLTPAPLIPEAGFFVPAREAPLATDARRAAGAHQAGAVVEGVA